MSEIHPAVDADLLAEQERELQIQEDRRRVAELRAAAEKEKACKRFKAATKQLLKRAIVALAIAVVLGMASGFHLVAPALAGFLSQVAFYWLAIQVGGWLQYTRKGRLYE